MVVHAAPPTGAEPANLVVALSLAAKGLAVFPVHSGGPKVKQPMPFFRWKDQSSTNEVAIREWWRRWPDAAPALDLGKSNLLVVDADRHDAEHDGVEAWATVLEEEGVSPDGIPIVGTPNNGSHWFFKQDGSFGNGKGSLPRGVDVRGSGGYVVAPGAILADGRAYEVFGDPAAAPMMPGWLAERISKKAAALQPATPSTIRSDRTVESASASLNEIADLLRFVPADVGYDEWVQVLMAVHAATGGSTSGLTLADNWSSGGSKYKAGEVAKKWRSFKSTGVNGATLAALARQYGADLSAIRISHLPEDREAIEHGKKVAAGLRGRQLIEHEDGTLSDPDTGEWYDLSPSVERAAGADEQYDLPDADLQVPGLVGEIADWICDRTTDPIRIHAIGAALSIVGTLVSRKVFSEQRPTGTHLYVGCIAPSGMGKQHPQDCIRLVLDEIAANGRLHTGWNVSLPAIAVSMAEHGSRIMVADEFADKLMGLKHKNASVSTMAISEGMRTLWGINTGTWTPDVSLNRGEVKVLRPAMGFYGASTVRDFSKSLNSKDITNGLFNRFLILPRFGEVERNAEPNGILQLPEGLKEKCRRLFNCVEPLQMTLACRGDTAPTPILVPFSASAEAMNEENKAFQADMMRASDEDEALGLYGRYAEMIKRVALVVACGRHFANVAMTSIEGEDMAFARRLVAFSIEQFVVMVRRDMVESLGQAQHKLILSIIRKAKVIGRGELTHRLDGRIPRRDRESILEALKDGENIEEKDAPPGPKGGRPKKVYVYRRG